jgi:nucleotide-binding universal stress UspA family protein
MIFNRIFIAIDGGAPAAQAVTVGSQLAETLGAEVTVFHAIEGPHPPTQDGASVEELVELERRRREEIFADLRGQLPASVIRMARVTRGEAPAAAILQAASEWAADLVVIGSHGREGLIGALLGSVAEEVVRRAPCAVLVIKSRAP